MKHDQCPTCGTKLGPLRDHEHARRCDACRRPNPIGFHYCGFCAAPMEDEDLRAEVARRAAPAGGWPSLARELVEVRFFIERGDLSEAFEMVQVLRQRYPGHPELQEFTDLTPTTRPKRIHTGVNQVVDAVLAGSADWANTKLPRRPAPQWKAPSVKPEGGQTQAHTTVPAAGTSAGAVHKRVHAPSREDRATRRGHQAIAPDAILPVINPAFREAAQQEASEQQVAASGLTGAVSVVSQLPARGESPPKTNRGKSASAKRRSTKKQKVAAEGNAASGSVRARADSQRIVEKPDKTVVHRAPAGPPPNTGHTVAVQTLQPAAPFAGEGEGEGDEEIDELETLRRRIKPKDGDKRRAAKRKGAKAAKPAEKPTAERTPEDDEKREAKARRRAAKFGQNIVGR